jgi:hypothetical protein
MAELRFEHRAAIEQRMLLRAEARAAAFRHFHLATPPTATAVMVGTHGDPPAGTAAAAVKVAPTVQPAAIMTASRPSMTVTAQGPISEAIKQNAETQTPLPPNADQALSTIYQQYEAYVAGGSDGSFTSSESTLIYINGTNVGIDAHSNGSGSFSTYVSSLTSLGMQVQASDARTGTVVGFIPISALPNAATLPQTLSLTPMYRPHLSLR